MQLEIIAMKDIPLMREYRKKSVVRTTYFIEQFDRVKLGKPITREYDHQEHVVFPIDTDLETLYVLEKDLGYNPEDPWHFEKMKIQIREQ